MIIKSRRGIKCSWCKNPARWGSSYGEDFKKDFGYMPKTKYGCDEHKQKLFDEYRKNISEQKEV